MVKVSTFYFSYPLSLLCSLACLAIFSCPDCLADGLTLRGHVNGPHTDLTLTKRQKENLNAGGKSIRLTLEQQKLLLTANPKAANITSLTVYPASTEACTCDMENVAVRVSSDRIEVANFLLVSK